MAEYGRVTAATVGALREIVGAGNVIGPGDERLAPYGRDESHDPRTRPPDVVVRPVATAEVADIMALATRERIPVTPRGAGTGLSGGAVPVHGGIVLSTERMNRILEIDTANMMAVVEPGVITSAINEAARPHGLFYAGYPMSYESCSIGGNVAHNAGGGRAIKYGVTGRHVLGLEVVLPAGEVIELGGKRLKDVTGYDLVHLLVGSEGTLGIVTRITLRLLPLPAGLIVLMAPFADLPPAIGAVPRLATAAHMLPSAIEFMDGRSLRAVCEHLGQPLPVPGAGALLIVEVDAPRRAEALEGAEAAGDALIAAGALDVLVGDTPAAERRIWRLRETASEALDRLSAYQVAEDLVAPPAAIAALVAALDSLAARHGLAAATFGHAGDGNVHARIIKPGEMALDAWQALIAPFLAELYGITRELGGTISAEHGIGSKRAPYLPLVLDPATIALQRRLKAAFDPAGILNPGKIFPEGGGSAAA